MKKVVECEGCGVILNYEGGCIICPFCGWRECNPITENVEDTEVVSIVRRGSHG